MMLVLLKLLMMLMMMVMLLMMMMMTMRMMKFTCPCHKKHFARAGAVEMHMELSQEEFCAEIYSENATR